ncbi:MAG: hypothetical protein GY866_43035, partial [Proteobacteria bacterium]|nr:hypothetical protein [Pseudomonadota bacterium]
PNNTVMNMVAKARKDRYRPFLLKLFTRPDIPFSFDKPIHNYLHLHGILDFKTGLDSLGKEEEICCFSSPFIQRRLYEALGYDMVGDDTPIRALRTTDDLTDVFEGPTLNLPALLDRYKDYLARLKAAGVNPWKDQPSKDSPLERFTPEKNEFSSHRGRGAFPSLRLASGRGGQTMRGESGVSNGKRQSGSPPQMPGDAGDHRG